MSTLDVKDLTVALPAGAERAEAVSRASFSVERGEIMCLVGESGSGKSVIAHAVMGLLPKGLRISSGTILLDNENLADASESRLRELRGARMSMIFQEPMTALNPVMRCGAQIDEVLRFHTGLSARERREKALGLLREVALARPRANPGCVPAPALRRPAPAHHDRHGARARAGAAHRRRADHRARRNDAGGDTAIDP